MQERFLTPSRANRNCSWTDLDCIREYHGNGTRLSCKHFAVRLPIKADQDRCLDALLPYTWDHLGHNESDPWATSNDYYAPIKHNFRPCLEGINSSDPYARGFERLGASLQPPHGATHTFRGGTLATPTSPNDPVFFHLHWNIHRLWAHYRNRSSNKWFLEGPGKAHLDEELPGFEGVTVRDTLDYKGRYGYTFDSL